MNTTTIRPITRGRISRRTPTLATYLLDAPVLPLLTDSVAVAEQARAALMALHRAPSPVLSGKDADSLPLAGHRHAHFLPEDRDGDGRLDHLLVWAPMGLAPAEQAALRNLVRLRMGDGRPDLGVVLQGLADRAAFAGSRRLGTAERWHSVTPFVFVRHPKRRRDGNRKLRSDGTWIDGPEDQLRRELRHRDLPEPTAVRVLPRFEGAVRGRRWIEFRRHRRHRRSGPGFAGFEIEFAEPVAGPIALGWGSHYGLGSFERE